MADNNTNGRKSQTLNTAITEAPIEKVDEVKERPRKSQKPMKLILAGLGVGALGYYWQYASTHEETDNAIVTGNIHQISSRIPGTIEVDSIYPASGAQFALLPPDNATGNFTKVVQSIPVKVIFDQKSIQGYAPRIIPGMSAEVSVDVKLGLTQVS